MKRKKKIKKKINFDRVRRRIIEIWLLFVERCYYPSSKVCLFHIDIYGNEMRKKYPSFFSVPSYAIQQMPPHWSTHRNEWFDLFFFNRKPYVYRALSFNQKINNQSISLSHSTKDKSSFWTAKYETVLFLCFFVNTFSTTFLLEIRSYGFCFLSRRLLDNRLIHGSVF